MENVGALFLRVAAVSAGCSAVVAPLLLLAPRLQRRVAARSFYVLFLLLALRLTVPVELSLPVRAVTVPAPEYTVSVPAPARPAPAQVQTPVHSAVSAPTAQAVPAPVTAARKVPVTALLGLAWAAGALACGLWAVGSYGLARRRLMRGACPAEAEETALLEELRAELGVGRPVGLYRAADAPGPLALGLFRPSIVLPAQSGREGVKLVLRHELTHIRRWDVGYKLVLSLACAVNWFNPLVWLMNRAAGRNLELCCDDEATRALTQEGRREYGRVLLAAAGSPRPLPFTTCFAGGKRQMKDRLLNLFTRKRNSAVLVCLVAAAALLAGGLVACEKANALSPENQERRALFQTYFAENYTEDAASVVLADLTGDGLEEMLVLTLDPDVEEPPSMRGELARFSYGLIEYFKIEDGAVVKHPGIGDVSDSHAGWGFVYLVPRETGYALVDFRPYIGQGMAFYGYGVYTLGEDGEFVAEEQDEVSFQTELDSLMGEDTGSDASVEEVEQFLERWRALRDSGVPLLVHYEGYTETGGSTEISYLSVPPADAFSGADMGIAALRGYVVTNHGEAPFALPPAGPATPEEALDRLESNLACYPDCIVFRLPNYEGTWDAQISGRMRMGEGDDFMSVRYLEGEEWRSGRRYTVETEGAWFDELTLWVRAIGPDGTGAERTILLAEKGQITWDGEQLGAIVETLIDAVMQSLTRSIKGEENGFKFTLPLDEVLWDIQADGRMRMGESDDFMSVHYLEEVTDWEPGRTYFVETGDAWFDELTLRAKAVGPDGAEAEAAVLLAGASTAPGDWGQDR